MEAVAPAQLGVRERVLDQVFVARRAERQDGAALRQHGLHEGGKVGLYQLIKKVFSDLIKLTFYQEYLLDRAVVTLQLRHALDGFERHRLQLGDRPQLGQHLVGGDRALATPVAQPASGSVLKGFIGLL